MTGTDRGFVIGEQPLGNDRTLALRYDAGGSDGGGTQVIKAGLTTTGSVINHLESASGVQTTDWQHVAMTWASGSQLKLYLDGVETVPTYVDAAATGSVSGLTTLIVGKGAKGGAADSWNGLIDDFRIYDRQLSPAEVQVVMTPTPPAVSTVTVGLPDGGEGWTAGAVETVTWGSTGAVGNVDILLSVDGGASYAYALALDTPNDGTQTVTVPAGLGSPACRVLVIESGGCACGASGADFTVTGEGDVDLDGDVDAVDIAWIALYFGQSEAVWPQADLDGSEWIDVGDFAEVIANWGNHYL